MKGTIEVRGLRDLVLVGVLAHEREAPQPVELDIDVLYDVANAYASDDLNDAVNYAQVVEEVRRELGSASDTLLEKLVARLAHHVLALDPRIDEVTLTLRKLRPPLVADVTSVGIRVTATR